MEADTVGRQQVGSGTAEPLSRLWRQLPFQGSLDRIDRASPERGGARKAGGGVLRRRIRKLQFMVPEFVERIGGSRLWGTVLSFP